MFKQVIPQEAEVLRQGKWIGTEASNLVPGDIIRIKENVIVPADCTVLSVGMEHTSEDIVAERYELARASFTDEVRGIDSELSVDHKIVMGEDEPRTVVRRGDGTVHPIKLFQGGKVLRGSAITIVTAVGNATLLGKLVEAKKWPLVGNLDLHTLTDVNASKDGLTAPLVDNSEIV